jgi:hypothetical protein
MPHTGVNLYLIGISRIVECEYGSVDKNWKIYLSHDGAQKESVEQLHVDLQHIYHRGVFF